MEACEACESSGQGSGGYCKVGVGAQGLLATGRRARFAENLGRGLAPVMLPGTQIIGSAVSSSSCGRRRGLWGLQSRRRGVQRLRSPQSSQELGARCRGGLGAVAWRVLQGALLLLFLVGRRRGAGGLAASVGQSVPGTRFGSATLFLFEVAGCWGRCA